MAFGGLESGGGSAPPMAEINTTPLVDVMLVLLVIFIVTAPLFTHAIRIDLPKAGSPDQTKAPEVGTIALDDKDQLHWNDQPVAADALASRLAEAAARQPQPELHLRMDRNARYERVALVMGAAREAGLARVGFVSLPRE